MNAKIAFADRLSALRRGMNLSKADLARSLGVSTTCVWNWEQANTYPRKEVFAKIAQNLNTTEYYLEYGLQQKESSFSANTDFGAAPNTNSTALKDVILNARMMIAEAAGLDIEKVKITLEY